jgi:hypothetical protein
VALAGEGWLKLYANDGKGKFEELPARIEGASHAGVPAAALPCRCGQRLGPRHHQPLQERADGGKVRSR